jgi:hypothetical protein
MKISSNLWDVAWEARFVIYPNHLWVLAESAEIAVRKARRYLKKAGNTGIKIQSVTSKGTIDVF